MPHDEHFLQRLDRVASDHLDIALGLYRDHELVRFLLGNVTLPDGAERVAIALSDGGQGPHLIVTRDGHFVTCLGAGMRTGPHPLVTRAQLDAVAGKHERVRTGLELARKRGGDASRLFHRVCKPGASREDYLAAHATVGPAAGMLGSTYVVWAKALDTMLAAYSGSGIAASVRRSGEEGLVRGAWAMMGSATLLIDAASRDWVEEWSKQDGLDRLCPWGLLTWLSAVPFVLRAAWIAARLGKPMLASYKKRFARPSNTIEGREAGWGLLAMGLRHEGLRAEIGRTLRSRKPAPEEEPWVEAAVGPFAELSRILDEKDEQLRAEGMKLGRDLLIVRTAHLPEGSPHRFTEASQVPDDLALPGVVNVWVDGHNDERAMDVMLVSLACIARARAEDFYYPAALQHAMIGFPSSAELGASLIEMRRKLCGVSRPVVKGEWCGRNEPCPCGSGKKYKKCHGR